jgi:hypothetical protein
MGDAKMRTLCVALATIVFTIEIDCKADSDDRYAPESYGIPSVIGEYDVLTVLTNDNFPCMRKGEKRLILRTQEPKMRDALYAFSRYRFNRDLQALRLGEHARWGFDIVGPGIRQQQLAGHAAESSHYFKTNPCIRLTSPLKHTELFEPSGEDRRTQSSAGYAIIENVDAGSYSDDNGQSVFFIAPVVGPNQEGQEGSALMNNVWTETNYFLQVGLLFEKDQGYVVWTDSSVPNLQAQQMYLPPEEQKIATPYNPNHVYGTLITHFNDIWWMCAGDYNADGTWSCHAEPKATGTNLQMTQNTSVFAENWNVTPEWFSGFSNPWIAFGAKIHRNGVEQDWSSQRTWTVHACSDQWLPENAISGSLASGGIAYFRLEEVPVWCK